MLILNLLLRKKIRIMGYKIPMVQDHTLLFHSFCQLHPVINLKKEHILSILQSRNPRLAKMSGGGCNFYCSILCQKVPQFEVYVNGERLIHLNWRRVMVRWQKCYKEASDKKKKEVGLFLLERILIKKVQAYLFLYTWCFEATLW